LEISDKHSYDIGFEEGKNAGKDIFLSELLSELAKELINQGQIEIVRRAIKKVENSANNIAV